MTPEFAGQVAIVTGGSRGIGKAVARLLADRGAALILVGRNPVTLEGAAREIGGSGASVVAVAGDVCESRTADAAVERAEREFGRLDILANRSRRLPHAAQTKKSGNNAWPGSTAYCAKSVTPAVRSRSSSMKKLPVHVRLGRVRM